MHFKSDVSSFPLDYKYTLLSSCALFFSSVYICGLILHRVFIDTWYAYYSSYLYCPYLSFTSSLYFLHYTGGNDFTPRPLPACFASLRNLEALFMANCHVRGPLPSWIGELTGTYTITSVRTMGFIRNPSYLLMIFCSFSKFWIFFF